MNTVTIVVPCHTEEPVLPAFLHECDGVATRRSKRKGEPFIRSLLSRCFYRFINSISETEFVPGERDFRLMKRHVVSAVLSLCESTRFTMGIFLMFIAFVVALVVIVVRKLMFGNPVDGWASIAYIILLAGSFQLLCIGIPGNCLSKTYQESKDRPAFIIGEDSDNGSC